VAAPPRPKPGGGRGGHRLRGGDTDTNAAICGSLFGAVCGGRDAISPSNGPNTC